MGLLADFLGDLREPKYWATGILLSARVAPAVILILLTRGILSTILAALAPVALALNVESVVIIFNESRAKLANKTKK